MYLLVAGFRYKNAPLEIRERLSFKTKDLHSALEKIVKYPSIKEALILSTCNRTEIYCLVEDTEIASGSIVRFLSDYHNIDIAEIRKYMFTLMHEDTVRQIFKVVSGLDSMVIGENQIVHQFKEALEKAQQVNTTGDIIDKLAKMALTTSKRIRSQTSINSLVTNISSAAIELTKKHLGDITDKRFTILGAGQMSYLAVKHLVAKYNHPHINIVKRSTSEITTELTDYDYNVYNYDELNQVIKNTDILFVCTSAPHFIIDKNKITSNKHLTIVDIAVPRNVDDNVLELPNVNLFNIDDIQQLINNEADVSSEMLKKAHNIVKEEAERFSNWLSTFEIIPTIKKVREKIETIRQDKVDKLRAKTCPYSHEKCLIVEELSKQIVKAILHDPTVRIKSNQNHEIIYQNAKMLSELFNIDE